MKSAFLKGAAKRMGMGSQRAADYLAAGSKNATRIKDVANKRVAQATAAGVSGPTINPHDVAIRMRQAQIGRRYAAGAVGLGVLGSQGNNRSSYRPPRPNTQMGQGSGRFA